MDKSVKFRYEFIVDQSFLDEYGHVNNAKYLNLYEEARWDILERSGFGRQMVRNSKVGPVILEVHVRFSREILPGQRIMIETTSRRKNELIFYFDQVMINDQGKVASKATFTSALFDLVRRKMVKPVKEWLLAFGFSIED